MTLGFANGVLSFAYGNFEFLLGELDGIARTFALADGHSDYFLTIRSTAWFTSSRAFLLADSRRVPFSLFADRSDWCCDFSSLVRFFAMFTVSHSPAPIATAMDFKLRHYPPSACSQRSR